MEIGDFIKVSLPGETPWAEVIEVGNPDAEFKGRIDNVLFHEMPESERQKFWRGSDLPKLHDFKFNDELWFEMRDMRWQPVTVN